MGVYSGVIIKIDTLRITPAVLAFVAEIDEFKGAWRALGTLAPERLSALRRVATIESIGSSTRIEGSKLSDREVERLLSNLEIKSFASRDEQEVAGYAEAMELVFRWWENIAIVENPPLARSLYKQADIGREIPADLYEAVAEVLAFVYQLNSQRAAASENAR